MGEGGGGGYGTQIKENLPFMKMGNNTFNVLGRGWSAPVGC